MNDIEGAQEHVLLSCYNIQCPLLLYIINANTGADLGFLKRGFICIKVWGLALLILSRFS